MCVIHHKLHLGVNYTGVKNWRGIPYLVSMGYLLCGPGI